MVGEGLTEIRFVFGNGRETIFKGQALADWYQQYVQAIAVYQAVIAQQAEQEAQGTGEESPAPDPPGVRTLSAAASEKKKKDK